MVRELLDSQGLLLIDALANEEDPNKLSQSLNNVPLLALPTENSSEMIKNSRQPSSRFGSHLIDQSMNNTLPRNQQNFMV